MVERKRLVVEPPPKFLKKAETTRFVSTGATLLDRVLNGGWGQGRIANIVGDKSAGKTLLAIEACANFSMISGLDRIRYAEAESAFDEEYAKLIGMPQGLKLARGIKTVEDFYADISKWLEEQIASKNKTPCLYVLDSLDALSDAAELERDITEGSFGAQKAKKLSEFFRRLTSEIEKANATLLIISQIRDKIGVTFGETKSRSGGKALDFYASQVVWLAEIKKIKRVVKGIDRVVGTTVLAKAKKMKMGPPFREAELSIVFNYGVDDEQSCMDWLKKNKAEYQLENGNLKDYGDELADARKARDRALIAVIHKDLRNAVNKHWLEIEEALLPTISKYGA